MSDQFTRKTKPKDLKEWLSQLEPVTDEEFARTYLTGEKPKDHDTKSEEALGGVLSGSPIKGRRSDLSRGLSARRHATKKPHQKSKMPDDNGIAALEDEQVGETLTSDAIQEVPIADIQSEKKGGRRPRSRAVTQPEPVVQKDANHHDAQAKQPEIVEPDFVHIRSIAIEGYEPDEKGEFERDQSALARLRKWFDKLSIQQKIGLFLAPLLALGLSLLLIVLLSHPPSHLAVTTPVVDLYSPNPIPILVILPDDQSFELGVGTIIKGSWNPHNAEWLEGTEVPRWLSLPWNTRLESVVRAFKANDPIQLKMSNSDILVYRFQSVQELSLEELDTFHANTTDLLIVLSKPGASTVLVIIATP